MDIRQLREWGKRLFDSVGANTKKAIAGVISAAMIVTVALVAIPAQADDTMIADPTTFTQWEQGIGDPTDPRSTGRVWTDKSVSTHAETLTTYDGNTVTVEPENGSFLVGLSAMSSAQKLIGVSNVTKPLDIVLVLDTSGSMNYGMDGDRSYAYDPIYANDLDNNRDYYVRVNGVMTQVRHRSQGWYYNSDSNRHYVTPKTSADDNDASHTQFYNRRRLTDEDRRIYALKQAVNGFIDETITANSKVSDENKKNRIGLVTYASDVKTQSELTYDLTGLKSNVNDLSASGATRADLGMKQAVSMLSVPESARADASKIVIFFTDGQPTSQSDFDNTVAKDAIGNAKTMKSNGASVYSVGIFEGANPNANISSVTTNSNETLKSNAFMQGVSSNYPNATSFTTEALGARAPNGNYYLAASDADALNAVFDSIWNEVSSNPTSPIQSTTQGGTTESQGNGVVTFTDQLGDYMRVTKMNSIVFAGTKHETVSSQTSADGSETRYTFEGSVTANEIYQAADLSTMQIVVKHNTGKTGDLVTVNVPAELLPLRLYTANVDKDGSVTTKINRTNPMRLFYEVNLQDGTLAKVANPDEQMRQYLADPANIDTDGSVRFLTNAYSKSVNGANGSTTAVFTPATTNDFYYFTQDTPLYTDSECKNRAEATDPINPDGKYYYQRVYYSAKPDAEPNKDDWTEGEKNTQPIKVLGRNINTSNSITIDGYYYARAGAPRTGLSRLYTAVKQPVLATPTTAAVPANPTGTATNAIAPDWVMNNVTVRLGNNGLLKLPIPGALTITERVVWPEGAAENPDKPFPFKLSLTDSDDKPLAGKYEATLNGQSIKVGSGYEFNLKDGETISIYGLPDGAKARNVQTDAGGNGWSVNEATQNRDIEANTTKSMEFVNTYALAPTTLAAGSIKGSKTLTGRDWQQGELFTFQIAADGANPDAPMPNPATVTVTNPNTGEYKDGQTIPFEFGAIEYRAPGTYQYVVTEQTGSKPGLQYSSAQYIVTVTVRDNNNGTMTATAVLTNTFNDNNEHIDGKPADSADFRNTFLGNNAAVATIRGIKHYTDHTGTNGNDTVGKFKVEITADESNPANGPTFTGPVTVPVKRDGEWSYDLRFTNAALNGKDSETFTYHVREVVPAGVDAGNPTKDGMTYDVNTYNVQITVSRDVEQNLITEVAYSGNGERVELTNSYRAAHTDPQDLAVTKTVTGRDAEAGKFTFNATLSAGAAQNVKVKQADGSLADWTDHAVKTPKIEKNGSADIDFGQLVFTMPGTYTFQVSEQLPEGVTTGNPKKDGWTYDTHTHTVTYTVTDDNGKLKAVAATDGSKTFTNAYTASTQYQGMMQIGKTLTGRSMNPGEFGFIIKPQNGAPMPGVATQATTTNPFSAVSGQELVWPVNTTLLAGLQFTQDDAGNTYEYTIREQMPEDVTADNPAKNGVTYDFTEHTASIEVSDNGNGTLSTKTWIDDDKTNTVARFKNTYKVHTPAVSEIGFAKTISGRDWKDGESFAFELTPNTKQSSVAEDVLTKAMPDPATVTVSKPGSGNTAAFKFTGFQFEQAGTYAYNVREQHADTTVDGLTYDDRTAVASFTVVDNGLGEYSIGRLITGIDFVNGVNTFTNAYKAKEFTGVPTGMAFSKELKGTEWTTDRAFEFTLTGKDGAPMPDGAKDGVLTKSVGKPDSGDTQTFDFGNIKYESAGKYEYEVKETKGDMPGVAYDEHSATVTVTVADNGKGQLEAKAEVVDGAFTNTYKANQVTIGSADMKLSKQLTGIEWPKDRTFEFTLEAVTKDAPMPKSTTATVAKPANGSDTASFGFGDITYTKTGTYEYVVKETKGDMPGVAYDSRTAKVTVTVTDDKAGQLKADVKTTDGTFVNNYTAEEANGVPTGMTFSKQLTGIAWPADRQFMFTLTGADGAPMPEGTKDGVFTKSVGKPAAGDTVNFDFGAITYTKEGTYTYMVKELNGVMPGVAFDDHTATVTVKVEDDKQGHLVATATVDKAAFVNKYTANEVNGVPANMEFSKQLTGTEWADRTFTFTLTGVDGAPMPAEATVTVGKPESGDTSTFKFGAIKYSKAGTYKYTVTEHNDGMGGIAYDDHTANVTVEVEDNGRGQLIAEATVENGKFTNTYSSAAFDGVPTGMLFSKQLTGIDWPVDRAFEFTLEGVDGAPMPAEAKVSVGKPADGDTASFNFGNIRYEQPGTYAYTVKETGGDMPGVTNDTHVANVTVEVKDNGNGQLEATATVTGGAFVNTYGAQPSDGVPEGMTFIKQLNGTAWPADRQFEFTLTGEGNAPMPQGAKDGKLNVTVGKPAGNGGTQTFDFGKIVYDAEGVYKYTVTEVKGDMPGVTYATNTATVTVTVTDDKAGKLVAKAEVTGGVFTNTYTANTFEGVPTNMEFSKQLTGVAWPEGRDFEFTLEGVNGAPMPTDAKAKATKPANGDTASFTFGAIRYDKVGTYEYTVRETKGDMPGVTYDGHAAKVTVTVSDNGKGQLEAKAEVAEGAFVNRYAAAPFEGVPTGMKLTKQLTGIAWPADRTFEFAIAAAEGTPMPAQTKISVGKPAAGDTASFDFGSIRYDKAGTYEYTVKEMRGTMPGVAYDGHTATITVTVTDNGTGNLQAEAKVSESQFVNKYSAQPATGVPTDFTLYKRVDGMAWNENQQFEFTIQGQDGAPMPENGTVTVGKPAEGDSASFDFGEIVYTRSGVYRYTVTEIAGNQPGMAYDGHTATITVDVVDDGQGHLVAATTVENGLFTNKYATQNVAYPGINVTEDLTGRAQAQGEFGFTVSGSDEDMQRAGYKPQARAVSGVYEFHAAASGETVTVPGLFTGLELTHDDVRSGRKFNYEIDQIGAQSGNGLTVDEQVYAVQIWATDNGDGTMRVHTSVNGTETSEKTPVLPFHNVYATAPVTIGGDAQVRINAHKTLHGRDLVNGEFHFAVRDAKDAQLAAGTNAADGTVRFDAIEFTDARLNADVKAGIATAHTTGKQTVYRYATTVAEITDSLPSGVTALESSFAVTLVITDNGDGQLQATVEYPADANGTLNFVNQYGAASEVSLGMNGNKVLAMASGDNAPDITGKYTFTLSGSEGAPMPEKTQVTNDASGAVDFGEIKFTVANVFGESAADKPEEKPAENAGETAGESAEDSAKSEESTETEGAQDAKETETDAETKDEPTKREKTFTYTVSESGTVAGVTNDAAAQRTIDVHVVDNGDGTLTVSRQSDAAGTAFTFTNTYGVQPVGPVSPTDPNVAGSVPLTKTLNGRDLRAGEFTFELVEASGEGRVVGTAANAADGTVNLPGVTFDKPGNYAYLVREVAGNAGGVSYDNRTYVAVAQVTDAGDGTLAVTWQITDPTGAAVQSMTFTNEYAAEPTSVQFSVGKMLDGRDLVANEFSFALRGADGDTPMPAGSVNGVQTMANDAEGNVQFGAIGYTKPGDYLYTVSEVKGDAEGVTYDETEYAVTVHVTDDGEGSLQADLQYADGAEGIVFRNTYVTPQEPTKPKPEEPAKPTPTPSQPSTPATPSAPTTPSAPSRPNAPSYSSGSHSTYTTYVGSMASTGSSIAIIVAVSAALVIAGAGLLLARKRGTQD
ncbi:hypothetical protein BAAM0499_06500 [Bifidobacterium animalis subsp. animalis MCC 0499]|uniref:Spy0128 family protein n=1 Tax=Bifidobacterium animalis TaxID=28025 RepID=UPI00069B1B8E|nr:FctA domain-containing protein [Bifidobacterium animalis]KOA60260.1 hypothetical protein BAAM0499_06500 [Bifidobacterium animalis subsp. animalis MCC 0499]